VVLHEEVNLSEKNPGEIFSQYESFGSMILAERIFDPFKLFRAENASSEK